MKKYFSVENIVFVILVLAICDYALNQPWKPEQFVQAFVKDAGSIAVPEEVREMKVLAQRNSLDSFSLGDELSKDWVIYQRATEFIYPIRLDSDSAHKFYRVTDVLPSQCVVVDMGVGVGLYACEN